MREIVHIQIGDCGNRISTRFWRTLIKEHCIDHDGYYSGSQGPVFDGANVYFRESVNGKYAPRAVVTDLDMSTMEEIVLMGRLIDRAGLLGGPVPSTAGLKGIIQKERS